ncbi:MAG: nucleotidyltransferase family protein [Pseudomonadota bacterium]
MGACALVMAGGRGERMAPYARAPKPLVPVAGVPLVVRNLIALLRHGFTDLWVSIPAGSQQLRTFLTGHCATFVGRHGGRLALLEEEIPLGTLGAAAGLAGRSDCLLVVNADNLTDLDLAAFAAHHAGPPPAAMTIAVHTQPIRVPWGQIETSAGRVLAYREKPRLPVQICSGCYVLGAVALGAMRRGQRCDAPDLVRALVASGEEVRAYEHSALWMDVNDAAAVVLAETLVREHRDAFPGPEGLS